MPMTLYFNISARYFDKVAGLGEINADITIMHTEGTFQNHKFIKKNVLLFIF